MAWISVDQKLIGGKLRSLYKSIGCSQNEAMGILVFLWLWGIDNAGMDGLIVSADRSDIADVLKPGLAPGLDAERLLKSSFRITGLMKWTGSCTSTTGVNGGLITTSTSVKKRNMPSV